MAKQSLSFMPIAISMLAAISYPTTNAAATAEVSPLQPTASAITVAQKPTPSDTNKKLPDVPAKLQVPAGNALISEVSAKGVQIYVCQPKTGDRTQFEWTLKAPEADLFNPSGALVGKHYGGPTWEYTKDKSKVVGEVKERVDSPDRTTIPWVLLSAKSNEGNGLFSKVTYIQRVNTKGGKAPATGCDSSKQNSTTRVDYTADYYFFAANK
ncbi:MAG: DUF3455 domain-containing protein [Microcoleus sp. PH2017_07_MST_O_A]|jgi:hypothetical protein|uniref:DUF3455 domain-containing protein n=1 Tax=Microcoleus sp. PH2017_30_WIL_O_A TaxID=2798840 RepID=UPI001D2A8093|nr:DUF3455 domain-containing protein [Microcoleus sp. PH2017_30_WIL_O_A]MCC3419671.1 DUF3455 domain-containing protein [Microcoleus sp. PH2017_07_MST_O_A]MCC3508118.1 DUF3455 domain-containing protein [Microcoleus sp. PH2017_17_BER_D_A]MCC3585499.1 DUF3455 domain-containing protein [Microcoleus sp. PH2017_30_WIL_O_A]